jgi:DNA-directed RNA polymerase subunit K/omega
VVQRPADLGVFEFVILSGLRAAQLMRGCTPRIESTHKLIMTAQMEVAAGKVVRAANALSEAVDIKDALEVGTRAPSAA